MNNLKHTVFVVSLAKKRREGVVVDCSSTEVPRVRDGPQVFPSTIGHTGPSENVLVILLENFEIGVVCHLSESSIGNSLDLGSLVCPP